MELPPAQLIFTSSRFQLERLERGRQIYLNLGGSWVGPHASPPFEHFYCGSRHDRLQSVLDALESEVRLLCPPRGGYGCAELLDQLPCEPHAWKNKTLVGFSDLTALHAFLSNLGLWSIHGPMVGTHGWLDADDAERQSWLSAITGKPQCLPLHYDGPKREGRLVGGNLTVLASLMGTPHQLKLQKGDLLFLEDVNEPPYRLTRSLFQLSHSPNFEDCTLIWGQLNDQPSEADSANALVEQLMESHPKNAFAWGLCAGHGRPNYSLILGQKALLSTSGLHLLSVGPNSV